MIKSTKTEIEVIFHGINELGIKESNEFYKRNIELGFIKPFKECFNLINGKRFKNSNLFYKKGLENIVGTYDCTQYKEDGVGYGPRFTFQFKHFNTTVYEVEVTEIWNVVEIK